MSPKFRELRKNELEAFLKHFTLPGSLKFRNNKWLGLNRSGKPFTIHIKHGTTRKYSPSLVEAIAKDLDVSFHEFEEWFYQHH
ncbi:hypothetical protein F9B85_10235 [Heliorestis acidaminivorans]|uniref:Type II toxin-antitoxin system HicA family toxin n=1 Tax=Heliorestis acidaminivorans TaxID=553427 RepID=A0A6I0EPN7_9FIRM|nr:hypothetical protein [Heliorestis acidaminivorans]KAB2951927.1 hypothetical protein F9B85_10235 [Heliorestis acidaminivorans]